MFVILSPIPDEAKTTEKIKIPSPPPAVSLLVSTFLHTGVYIFLNIFLPPDVKCDFKILFDEFGCIVYIKKFMSKSKKESNKGGRTRHIFHFFTH